MKHDKYRLDFQAERHLYNVVHQNSHRSKYNRYAIDCWEYSIF